MLFNTAAQRRSINADNPKAFIDFTDALHHFVRSAFIRGYKSIVFVCIGTDRSTGDSLGPLVGYKICGMKYTDIYVHGTLENPVHAKNLDEVMAQIGNLYTRPFIVAIDACLGKMDHVGYINIGEGSIKPGSGVNKNLAPVGDIYITGIVNFGGFMDFLVLQNTRLSLVMKMADIISTGIQYVMWKINSDSSGSTSLPQNE